MAVHVKAMGKPCGRGLQYAGDRAAGGTSAGSGEVGAKWLMAKMAKLLMAGSSTSSG